MVRTTNAWAENKRSSRPSLFSRWQKPRKVWGTVLYMNRKRPMTADCGLFFFFRVLPLLLAASFPARAVSSAPHAKHTGRDNPIRRSVARTRREPHRGYHLQPGRVYALARHARRREGPRRGEGPAGRCAAATACPPRDGSEGESVAPRQTFQTNSCY